MKMQLISPKNVLELIVNKNYSNKQIVKELS